MKARRSALSAAYRAEISAAVAQQAIVLLRPYSGATVSAFLSIGDEIDTAPILAALAAAGHRTCLPAMHGKTRPLHFRAFRPGDALQTAEWGIREPLATAPAAEPDVVLVPLLAFDPAGHRLGYGGGYYDRTLRELRARRSIVAAGLAFDEQEVDAVPHLDYDERLDCILTPTRLLQALI